MKQRVSVAITRADSTLRYNSRFAFERVIGSFDPFQRHNLTPVTDVYVKLWK